MAKTATQIRSYDPADLGIIIPTVGAPITPAPGTPFIPRGEVAKRTYGPYVETTGAFSSDHFRTALEGDELVGLGGLDAILHNQLFHPHMRVASLPDFINGNAFALIEGKHWSRPPNIVIYSESDPTKDANNPIIRDILELWGTENTASLSQAPVLVSNIRLVPSDREGYGVKVEPLDDRGIKVVQHAHLRPEYRGKKFNDVDENGVPTEFVRNGRFTLYPRSDGNGAAAVCVCGDGGVDLDDELLSYSNWFARVVFVPSEAGALEISRLSAMSEDRKSKLDARYEEAKAVYDRADEQVAAIMKG